jgi:acetyl esterase
VPILDLRCDTESHYEFATGYMLGRDDNLFVIEEYLAEPEDRWDWRASPVLTPSLRGVAPALIHCGEWDILRDEARQYADRLRDAGVDVVFRCYEGQSHVMAPDVTEKAKLEATEVIRRYIGPEAAG